VLLVHQQSIALKYIENFFFSGVTIFLILLSLLEDFLCLEKNFFESSIRFLIISGGFVFVTVNQ
tara:strand:- start:483 stop:674 length:192 start_codon:yes stop_codon:yes gene_type:complete